MDILGFEILAEKRKEIRRGKGELKSCIAIAVIEHRSGRSRDLNLVTKSSCVVVLALPKVALPILSASG